MNHRAILLLAALVCAPRAAWAQDVETLQQSCNDGSAMACFRIGDMFRTGESVERDAFRATVYLERACNEGAMPGCAALGMMYQRGEGVDRDTWRAVGLFEQACDGDALDACTRLGMMYVNGNGVPRDFELAAEYYERACAGDDLLGCANLGLLYQRGYGVEQDEDRAQELFSTACGGALAQACALATDGNWELTSHEPDADPPSASVRVRRAAGEPASFRITCTPERTDVTLEWAGELGEDDVPLTTSLGAEQTTAEDWEFDPEEDRHTYSGDARALIATLSRLESQTLFVSIPEGSASFAMAGLSVVAVPLGTACGWTGG